MPGANGKSRGGIRRSGGLKHLGDRSDGEGKQAGLASLTASMLTYGTQHRTFAQIGEQVESLGAVLSFGSGGHTTTFTAKCLVEDLSLVLDILTDCLYHPTFPSEYIEKRRGEVLTALQERAHDTRLMARLCFHELMYPNHPYGRSSLGYEETIRSLSRADVETFYREHYGTQGARPAGAVIVGAVPLGQGLDVLERALGTWQGSKQSGQPLAASCR